MCRPPVLPSRHLANMTPSQFSSFIGSKLVLPGCNVPIGIPRKSRTRTQYRTPPMMSFLGVGAPEAILVAVVALVVFGPKGLAEAAKSVGQALRAFQPTIREVVEVSQDLKGTLEKELGLDEIRQATRPVPRPRTPSSLDEFASGSGTAGMRPVTEAEASTLDPEIALKRAASEELAWGTAPQRTPAAAPAPQAAAALTIEELEAELARRKATATAAPASTPQAPKAGGDGANAA